MDALGPWFHNLDLHGVPTAPSHFLGDYPAVKWRNFAEIVPKSLKGKTVLRHRVQCRVLRDGNEATRG